MNLKIFEILDKYKNKGCFLFRYDQHLEEKCTAPNNKSGVYIVTTLTRNPSDADLLYIGCSGHKDFETRKIVHRESSGGGLYGRLVNGHQFEKKARKITWPKKMIEEKIDYLKVYWFDTENDNPEGVESRLLNECNDKLGGIPRWNNELPPRDIPL